MTIPVTTRSGKGSSLTQSDMDTNLTNLARDSSEAQQGNVQLASTAEATTGTNTTKAVTPAGLQAKFDTIDNSDNRTWQDLTASRNEEVTYTNSTGQTIVVNISCGISLNGTVQTTVDGIITSKLGNPFGDRVVWLSSSLTVPDGSVYRLESPSGSVNNLTWAELR